MGTIVVGYVPKPEGEAALKRGIEEARRRDAKLLVFNSHRGGDDADGGKAPDEDDMAEVKARLKDAGVDAEVRQLVRGFEPSEDLLNFAKESDAELIVIGLRRRSPVGKLILGSNAQRVLLDADCAVLSVKSD